MRKLHQHIATVLLAGALVLAAGCTSNAARIDARAASQGFTREVLTGTSWRHVIYMQRAATDPTDAGTLAVFFDSDGRPWTQLEDPVPDPTTANAVALELMAQTPLAAAYVARPCYQLREAHCSPEQWTRARYSEDVVASLTAVVRQLVSRTAAQRVMLFGYSGGGTLAVLVAERLDNVAGVVTIAANLDVMAWTTLHAYSPLTDSLDPAQSAREHPWPEIHLSGGRDDNVPHSSTDGYFKRYPLAKRSTYEGYDHVCCWARDWARIYAEVTGDWSLITSRQAQNPHAPPTPRRENH